MQVIWMKIWLILKRLLRVNLATVPGPPSGALGFIAFGGDKLWGTSLGSNKIYCIGTTMIDSTFLYCGSDTGGMDGTLETATFTSPNGIYSNVAADTLYVSKYSTGKLRRITPDYAGIKNEIQTSNLFSIYPNPSSGSIIILNNAKRNQKGGSY